MDERVESIIDAKDRELQEVSVTLQSFIRLIQHGILFLTFVVLVTGCGRDADVQSPPIDVTVAAGGMVLPTPVNLPTVAMDIAVNAEADSEVDTGAPHYVPGQVLQAAETLLLYADADRGAAVMNQYAAATEFTVLEPSGNYSTYPVLQAEAEWYRLRAADGLVGWATAERLALVE